MCTMDVNTCLIRSLAFVTLTNFVYHFTILVLSFQYHLYTVSDNIKNDLGH